MKRKSLPSTGSEGFTLVEVIVTVVILMLGMVVVLGVFLGAAKASSHAHKVDIAHYLAQETIEQFRNTPFPQILPFYESYGDIEGFPNYRRVVQMRQIGSLKTVRVFVFFDNDQRSSHLISYYTDI
jgi:type II secretory pathway pseudopilin PulG